MFKSLQIVMPPVVDRTDGQRAGDATLAPELSGSADADGLGLPTLSVSPPRPNEEREYLTAAEQHLLLQATRPATFGTYNSGRQERPLSALPRPRPQRARSRRWRPGRPASAQPPRVHPVPVAPLPRSPNMQFVRSNKLTGRRTVFARSIAQAAAARRAARFAAGAGGQVL